MSQVMDQVIDRKMLEIINGIPGYDPFRLAGDCWFDQDAADLAVKAGRQLLNRYSFSADEIETILAHELGHHINHDIPLGMVFQTILTLGEFDKPIVRGFECLEVFVCELRHCYE